MGELRYRHYQAIKGKLLAYRRDPDDPNSGFAPGTINLTLPHLPGVARQVGEPRVHDRRGVGARQGRQADEG